MDTKPENTLLHAEPRTAPLPTARADAPRGLHLNARFRLFWSAQYRCHLLMDGPDVWQLNTLAADILEHCDGQRSVDQLIALLGADKPAALHDDIRAFVTTALRRGWLQSTP